MKMKVLNSILSIVAIASLIGCDPMRFSLIGGERLDCRILSTYGSVKSDDYSFELLPNACVKMTAYESTQPMTTMWLNLSSGKGVKILLRSNTQDKIIDSGIVVSLTSNGHSVDSSGHRIAMFPYHHIDLNKPIKLSIYNDEGFLQFAVGCDTLVKQQTSVMAPDDLVFSAMDSSRARIFSTNWEEILFDEE